MIHGIPPLVDRKGLTFSFVSPGRRTDVGLCQRLYKLIGVGQL